MRPLILPFPLGGLADVYSETSYLSLPYLSLTVRRSLICRSLICRSLIWRSIIWRSLIWRSLSRRPFFGLVHLVHLGGPGLLRIRFQQVATEPICRMDDQL